jgi:ATP-binding cassette subfamily B protein/subfamily B ATP-binding cassette protein MsbA
MEAMHSKRDPRASSSFAVVSRDYLRAGSYFFRHARSIGFLVVLGLLASGLAVLQPWPLKLLIDTVLGGKPDAWMRWAGIDPKQHAELLIIIATIAAFLAYALASIVEMVLSYGWMKAGQKMVYDVAADLYAKLQQRSLAHHQERTLGDSLNRLFGDSWSLYTISYTLLTVPLQHALTIAIVGIIAWQIDPTLTLIALGAVPVATVVSYVLAQMLRRLSWQEARLTSEIMTFVQQTLSVIPLVQTFAAASRTQKIYRAFAQRSVGIAGRTALVNQTVLNLNTMTVAQATSAVFLVGG